MNAKLKELLDRRMRGDILEAEFYKQCFSLPCSQQEREDVARQLPLAQKCAEIRSTVRALYDYNHHSRYSAISVTPIESPNDEPSVGFVIRLRDEELVKSLQNYAYRIEFVS